MIIHFRINQVKQYVYLEKGSVSENFLEMKQECFILAASFEESKNILKSINSILSDDFLLKKSGVFFLKLKSSVKQLLKLMKRYDLKNILSPDDLMFFNGISETSIDQLGHVKSLELLYRLSSLVSCVQLQHRFNLPPPDVYVNIFFF